MRKNWLSGSLQAVDAKTHSDWYLVLFCVFNQMKNIISTGRPAVHQSIKCWICIYAEKHWPVVRNTFIITSQASFKQLCLKMHRKLWLVSLETKSCFYFNTKNEFFATLWTCHWIEKLTINSAVITWMIGVLSLRSHPLTSFNNSFKE